MFINIPMSIPDDSLFRIRKADGTLWGRGHVFNKKANAQWRVSYDRLVGAKIEVIKPDVFTTYPYNRYGRA